MLNDNSVKEYNESVPGPGLMSRYCYESLDTDTQITFQNIFNSYNMKSNPAIPDHKVTLQLL